MQMVTGCYSSVDLGMGNNPFESTIAIAVNALLGHFRRSGKHFAECSVVIDRTFKLRFREVVFTDGIKHDFVGTVLRGLKDLLAGEREGYLLGFKRRCEQYSAFDGGEIRGTIRDDCPVLRQTRI